jgi:hypothetical protein
MPLKPISKKEATSQSSRKGSLTLPWKGGEITWFPNDIFEVRYKQDEREIILVHLREGGKRTFVNHAGFKNIVPVFQDMLKRALNGQHANYQDYNKDGSRKTRQQKALTAPRPRA